jgi:hypothetical protein
MLIHGKCHCGNISFTLTWEPEPETIPARVCTCSFCAKHGGVWTSKPDGGLEIRVMEPALVSEYAFGTRTAQFHICTRCGVAPVVTSRIDKRLYAVVSVNAFEGVDPAMLNRTPMNFQSEEEGTRLARRKRTWIANVSYAKGGS